MNGQNFKSTLAQISRWQVCFWLISLTYSLIYAPFGINETDGGFLTGLAWQVLSGKNLYSEIIYVRPPLPVFWRAAELWLLPDGLEIMAERVFFYWKVGLYSFLAASILAAGPRRWWFASLGFVVSVHCYPAAAWHTVDGILMSVTALFFLFKNGRNPLIFNGLAGVCTVAAMGCKQSFFPMAAVLFAVLCVPKLRFGSVKNPKLGFGTLAGAAGFFGAAGLFFFWLHRNGTWDDYFFWTNGASSLAEAWQHGFVDFFKIDFLVGLLAIFGAIFFGLICPKFFGKADKTNEPSQRIEPADGSFWIEKQTGLEWKIGQFSFSKNGLATGFLLGLLASYWLQLVQNQSFTAPVSQSRLLFLATVGLLIFRFWKTRNGRNELPLAALLSVSWMASVSWGYNFPILFATPMLAGLVRFKSENWAANRPFWKTASPFLPLILCLLTFRAGYEFIYRDGRRAEMTVPLGPIFPKLNGIFTDQLTSEKYAELRRLHEKWPGPLAVLPSFPLANYLLTNGLRCRSTGKAVSKQMGITS